MAAQFQIVLFLAITTRTYGDSVTDGTNLVSTFLIHRHGDRTPVEATLQYSTNFEELRAASAPYGYGQLTTLGMQRAYTLGKYIRSRYDELLSDQYNSSEIYIRSTDSTRTKMTVLLAMAAVFPAYPGCWSEEINWVPTPYTTAPVKYDFLHLKVPIKEEIAAILPELKAAADVAMDVVFGDENVIAYLAGPLLQEFFTYADMQIAKNDTPRVRIYSAHDVTVYSLMAVSQITPRQGLPKYAAAFSLELRQVEETGEYVVLAVYQPSPGEDLVYLPVVGCDGLLCPYDTFKNIVSPYVLDEDTWRNQCGYTDDLVIDHSPLALI